MKTVIIFDQVLEKPVQFLVVDGDYSHLNQKYMNSCATSEEDSDELASLVFDENWDYVSSFLEKFPTDEVMKGAKVIVAGFLP